MPRPLVPASLSIPPSILTKSLSGLKNMNPITRILVKFDHELQLIAKYNRRFAKELGVEVNKSNHPLLEKRRLLALKLERQALSNRSTFTCANLKIDNCFSN